MVSFIFCPYGWIFKLVAEFDYFPFIQLATNKLVVKIPEFVKTRNLSALGDPVKRMAGKRQSFINLFARWRF